MIVLVILELLDLDGVNKLEVVNDNVGVLETEAVFVKTVDGVDVTDCDFDTWEDLVLFELELVVLELVVVELLVRDTVDVLDCELLLDTVVELLGDIEFDIDADFELKADIELDPEFETDNVFKDESELDDVYDGDPDTELLKDAVIVLWDWVGLLVMEFERVGV